MASDDVASDDVASDDVASDDDETSDDVAATAAKIITSYGNKTSDDSQSLLRTWRSRV